MELLSRIVSYFFQYFLAYYASIFEVMSRGGWIVFLVLLSAIFYKVYMNAIETKFVMAMKWTYLKIRVPENNTRNPRSMEEAFNAIHGIEKKPDLLEVYLDGFVPAWITCEIRGTAEGVSFIMRVPTGNVPMVQAIIYAQYPDAEIEETSDYTIPYSLDRLEKDFDVWGCEWLLAKEDAYPIKTYIDFEDQFAEDSRFVDPMATVSEVVGTLKPGEELWIQILARPVWREDWKEEGKNLALKLAGREVPKKKSLADSAFEALSQTVATVVTLGNLPEDSSKEKKGTDLGVLRLTPGELDLVKAIQRNVSKVAYDSLVRSIYIAAKPVFNRKMRVNALLGSFRQYLGANQFKLNPRFTTSRPVYGLVSYRQRMRKRRILQRYQWRYFAEKGYVLNVEELATIFHFPVEYTKAPSVERARAKKGEAPHNIPLAPEDLPLA